MDSKKWFFRFISSMSFILVLFSLVTILVDPYFHYHKPFSFLSYRLYEERYINDGISRNFDFDAMITGSSMTQNFKPSEANLLFGTTTVKESFSGSGYQEQSQNIERAINRNSNLKMIIWGLDYNGLLRDYDWKKYEDYPTYLYDNSILNDVSYLLNKSIMYHGTLLNIYMTATNKPSTTFDEYSFWDDGITLKTNLPYLERSKKNKMITKLSDDSRNIVYQTINNNVVTLANAHPNTTFYIFFTPYSICYWDYINREGNIICQIEAEEQAIKQLLECKNIRLFCFYNEHEIINNPENYRDTEHYNSAVNSILLQHMAEGKNEINKENYKQHLADTKAYYLNYDYDSIFEK